MNLYEIIRQLIYMKTMFEEKMVLPLISVSEEQVMIFKSALKFKSNIHP